MDENTARRAAVEFLGGQVQESGFRVGVPISCRRRVGVPGSCRCPRRVRRGLDATASGGVPYDVRCGDLHRAGLTGHLWGARRLTCGVLVGGSATGTVGTTGHAELRTSSEGWIASLLSQWTVHSEALFQALDLPKKSARPSDVRER